MKDGDNRMDELLRNRLEQFSAQPPFRVWQGIRTSIHLGKSPNKTLYIKWLAVAAVLFVAMVTGILLNNNVKEINSDISEFNQPSREAFSSSEDSPGNENKPIPTSSDISQVSVTLSDLPVSDKILTELHTDESEIRKSEITFRTIMKITPELNSGSAKNQLHSLKRPSEIINADNLTDADKKIIAGNLLQGSKEGNSLGWKVGMHLSPGYSSHSASHSAGYANNMTYAYSEARANLGAGFSVQYKTGSRWSVETGMYYSQTGGSSGNSFRFSSMRADFTDAPHSAEKYFNTGVTNQMGQLSMNSTAGVIKFSHTPTNTELISMPEASFGLSTAMLTPGEFQQVFEFVEIPLFARYRIVDSKIDVEWSGGISTNILAGNNVYMESGSGRERVGYTQDISTLNFSGATGIGVIYAMGKNLSLSVEPRVSYYLNSINHGGKVNFKPWRVGVFTGLSYEF